MKTVKNIIKEKGLISKELNSYMESFIEDYFTEEDLKNDKIVIELNGLLDLIKFNNDKGNIDFEEIDSPENQSKKFYEYINFCEDCIKDNNNIGYNYYCNNLKNNLYNFTYKWDYELLLQLDEILSDLSNGILPEVE